MKKVEIREYKNLINNYVMNKDNLEIERKFLLKNVPNFIKNEIKRYMIHQIYVEIDGKTHRFRMSETMGSGDSKNDFSGYNTWVKDFLSEPKIDYVHCVKVPISHGVFEEIEEGISRDKFMEMENMSHTYIIKTRYVYEHNELKWEVDEYHDIKLVTLEVELDDINQDITIPEVIEKELITEVTGQKVFSNQSLSIKGELTI